MQLVDQQNANTADININNVHLNTNPEAKTGDDQDPFILAPKQEITTQDPKNEVEKTAVEEQPSNVDESVDLDAMASEITTRKSTTQPRQSQTSQSKQSSKTKSRKSRSSRVSKTITLNHEHPIADPLILTQTKQTKNKPKLDSLSFEIELSPEPIPATDEVKIQTLLESFYLRKNFSQINEIRMELNEAIESSDIVEMQYWYLTAINVGAELPLELMERARVKCNIYPRVLSSNLYTQTIIYIFTIFIHIYCHKISSYQLI